MSVIAIMLYSAFGSLFVFGLVCQVAALFTKDEMQSYQYLWTAFLDCVAGLIGMAILCGQHVV